MVATVLLVLILCVVGIGLYRGWFAVSSHSADSGNGKVNINLTVDTDKARQDAEEGEGKGDGTRQSGNRSNQAKWQIETGKCAYSFLRKERYGYRE